MKKLKQLCSIIPSMSPRRKTISHFQQSNIKRSRHTMLEIWFLVSDRHKNMVTLNRSINPLNNWISDNNTDTCITKQSKTTCTNLFPFKKITHYHKNKWKHKHGQYKSKVIEWQHKHGHYKSKVIECSQNVTFD